MDAQETCDLFRLPRELRDQIYDDVISFGHFHQTRHYNEMFLGLCGTYSHPPIPLMLACKRLYTELRRLAEDTAAMTYRIRSPSGELSSERERLLSLHRRGGRRRNALVPYYSPELTATPDAPDRASSPRHAQRDCVGICVYGKLVPARLRKLYLYHDGLALDNGGWLGFLHWLATTRAPGLREVDVRWPDGGKVTDPREAANIAKDLMPSTKFIECLAAMRSLEIVRLRGDVPQAWVDRLREKIGDKATVIVSPALPRSEDNVVLYDMDEEEGDTCQDCR